MPRPWSSLRIARKATGKRSQPRRNMLMCCNLPAARRGASRDSARCWSALSPWQRQRQRQRPGSKGLAEMAGRSRVWGRTDGTSSGRRPAVAPACLARGLPATPLSSNVFCYFAKPWIRAVGESVAVSGEGDARSLSLIATPKALPPLFPDLPSER